VWWTGYACQEYCILDDYRGGIDASTLLRITDRSVHPGTINLAVKGSTVPFGSRVVVITSNTPPCTWARWGVGNNQPLDALLRRCASVTYFGGSYDRVSGLPNPDDLPVQMKWTGWEQIKHFELICDTYMRNVPFIKRDDEPTDDFRHFLHNWYTKMTDAARRPGDFTTHPCGQLRNTSNTGFVACPMPVAKADDETGEAGTGNKRQRTGADAFM
jgi:hypothetical protein